MRMIMPTVEELVSTRYRLMMRGYLNQSDVMRFVPCGQKRAREIMKESKNKKHVRDNAKNTINQ